MNNLHQINIEVINIMKLPQGVYKTKSTTILYRYTYIRKYCLPVSKGKRPNCWYAVYIISDPGMMFWPSNLVGW